MNSTVRKNRTTEFLMPHTHAPKGKNGGKRFLTSRDLPHKKDENGKPLCRWCEQSVAPPRRSWCSDECVQEYLIRSSADTLRSAVLKRDKGVCACCGADTEKIQRVISHAERSYDKFTDGLIERRDWQDWPHYAIWPLFGRMGFNRNQTFWEADHIIEVSNGGETSLDNIQTLCVPCHKAKTKQMHADRKFQRTGVKPKPPVRETQLTMI
jgi:5-methylcytosine-specific restriction enzyme A